MERETMPNPPKGMPLQPLIPLNDKDDEGDKNEREGEISRLLKRMGLIWAILAALSLAVDTVFIQKLTYKFSPIMILFYRQAVLLSFVLFLPWAESKAYDRYDLLLNVLFGLGDTFGKSAFMTALKFIAAGDVSAIVFNKPVPASIIACIFLGEVCDRFDGALVVANCIGLVMIAEGTTETSNGSSSVYGVIFSFTALASFVSIYFLTRVLAKKGKADPCLLSFMTGWIGVVLSAIYLTATSLWLFPQTLNDGLMFLAVGGATLIHYYSLTRALKTENLMFVVAGLSMTIPITYCYDALFNGHIFAWQTILGAILTVSSTTLLYAKTYCKKE